MLLWSAPAPFGALDPRSWRPHPVAKPSARAQAALEQCRRKDARAGPPPHFAERTQSDRWDAESPALLVRNATVWTGEKVVHGADVRMDRGIITSVERTGTAKAASGERVLDAQGRWLTPGIVDVHTHLGVYHVPTLAGVSDGNSFQGPAQPYLRSLDGINEHDMAMRLTQAGGVTTALVLPGSLNNMGGQGFPIKLRPLHGQPPSARVVDAPESLVLPGEGNQTRSARLAPETGMQRTDGSTAFRYLKMACGENPRKYGLGRMDEAFVFRENLDAARKLRDRQDAFCESLEADPSAEKAPEFPTDLRLEALVDLLRGRVKLQTHCYTVNDLDAFVRHSNEFRFPVAAFHHAHEAYLVPEVLRRAYGGPPAVAMFSTNGNYKYEAYFGSPFAGPLLAAHNITPIYKSDHPVTDSRRLLSQAAQAHHFGLSTEDALRAITAAPARVLGLDHRIGHVRSGWDADVVLWDRHPLQLGATPVQVVVDGAEQLTGDKGVIRSAVGSKAARMPAPDVQAAPKSADFASEIERVRRSTDKIVTQDALAFPTPQRTVDAVVLSNVSQVLHRVYGPPRHVEAVDFPASEGVAVYANGWLVCFGEREKCMESAPEDAVHIDARGGVVAPGIVSYGATLGLSDIPSEADASDGRLPRAQPSEALDPLAIAQRPLPRAADGLVWGGHDLLRAHASGVTSAVVSPAYAGLTGALSSQFDTGAHSVLDAASVRASETAVHVALQHRGARGPPLSEQVALLRSLLEEAQEQRTHTVPAIHDAWLRVVAGQLPLVVRLGGVSEAAQVVLLKRAFPRVRFVLESASALRHIAHELAEADVPVIVPLRTWMLEWDTIGRLPGAPLSNTTELGALLEQHVRVGVSIAEAWEASNLLWEARAALMDASRQGTVKMQEVFTLLTTALEDVLQLPPAPSGEFVAYDGDPTNYGSKVLAVGTPRGVEIFP